MERATVTNQDFPVTTRTMLHDLERIAATHADHQVNQGILALVRARKALNDARLALLFARRFFQAEEKVHVRHRLESMASTIEQEQQRFPLSVVENGGGHERPRIFPQHE